MAMKRKAAEGWTTDQRASSQGCFHPSMFDCYGNRPNTESIGGNSSIGGDENDSLLGNPYLFVDFDASTLPAKTRKVEASSGMRAKKEAKVLVGRVDDGPLKGSALDGEQLLASEMQALSVNEREEVYNDIHGVGKGFEESPDLLKRKLELFEQQLVARHQRKQNREQRRQQIQQQSGIIGEPYEHQSAYQEALFLAPRYVKNPEFRLLFLRSESFDVSKAAAKFVRHFELKKRFFGGEKLGKSIEFSDLQEDDVDALRNGSAHVIPNFTDRGGRCVFLENFYCYKSTNQKDFRNEARLTWYAFMRELEKDIVTQRKGIVAVLYGLGASTRDFTQLVIEQRKNALLHSLPLQGLSCHFCLDNPQIRPLFSMFLAAIPKSIRLRTRIHFGSNMECQYALATYGITSDLLPYESDGSVNQGKMEHIISTLRTEDDKLLRAQIQQETKQGMTLYATSLDVLLGKGIPYQNSHGTLRMLRLVEQNMPRYISATDDRFSKTTLFLDIVQLIKGSGGRFLKRHKWYDSGGVANCQNASNEESIKNDPNIWLVLDDEVAREKVSAAFRSMSKRLQNKQQT